MIKRRLLTDQTERPLVETYLVDDATGVERDGEVIQLETGIRYSSPVVDRLVGLGDDGEPIIKYHYSEYAPIAGDAEQN